MPDYISYEKFLLAYPWLLNGLSLTCAYLLSNGKVVTGRLIGAFAAINWSVFGYLTDQYAFLFANIIFFIIYTSAVLKFRRKRDSYKETFDEQEERIKQLEKALDKKTRMAERKLMAREIKMNRHAERARKSLEALLELSSENIEDLDAIKKEKAPREG